MTDQSYTERDRQILARVIAGESYLQLARSYKISRSRIGQIVRKLGGPSRKSTRPRCAGLAAREMVYRYLVEYKAAHQGATPTIPEITTACCLSSTSVAYYHLHRLDNAGRIEIISSARRKLAIAIPGAKWIPPEA